MSTIKEEHAQATNILLRKQVGSLRERIKLLSKTNSKLKHQSRVNEKDTNDFVEYFQNEINFLNEKNLELQAQISMLVKESKDYRERSLREHAEVVSSLKSKAEKTQLDLQEQVLTLTSQLEDVAQFRKEKSFMLDQLETLRESVVSSEEKKREEIASLERKFLEEKQRMQADYDAKIVQVEKTAADKAMKNLDRKVKLLFIENEQTVKELRMQKEANEDLKNELDGLHERVRVLNREQALFDEARKMTAVKSAKQLKELEERAHKISALEAALQLQVTKADSQHYRMQQKYNTDVGELKLEIQGLRQLIKLKAKEFRKMKRLAQTILDQRSDTETFFNEALDRVRHEKMSMVREAERQEKVDFNRQVREANLRNGKRFPTIRKTAENQEKERPAAGPITFRNLTLGDRERILELLFARINNQQRELRARGEQPVVDHMEDEVDKLARSTNTPRAGNTPSVVNLTVGESSAMRPEME